VRRRERADSGVFEVVASSVVSSVRSCRGGGDDRRKRGSEDEGVVVEQRGAQTSSRWQLFFGVSSGSMAAVTEEGRNSEDGGVVVEGTRGTASVLGFASIADYRS
jgi:hypothetical protein